MSLKRLVVTFSLTVVAASPALAQAADRDAVAGAPAAGPDARYCLRVEPLTGTLTERVRCWTRDQWDEQGVDVDKAWAKDGVNVIG
jgi:hypothetical protein